MTTNPYKVGDWFKHANSWHKVARVHDDVVLFHAYPRDNFYSLKTNQIDEGPHPRPVYKELTVAQLRQELKDRGISFASSDRKRHLVSLLAMADHPFRPGDPVRCIGAKGITFVTDTSLSKLDVPMLRCGTSSTNYFASDFEPVDMQEVVRHFSYRPAQLTEIIDDYIGHETSTFPVQSEHDE